MKNTHSGKLLLVNLQAKPAPLLKVTFLHECFARYLNGTNGTKSCNASYIESIDFKLKLWHCECCSCSDFNNEMIYINIYL